MRRAMATVIHQVLLSVMNLRVYIFMLKMSADNASSSSIRFDSDRVYSGEKYIAKHCSKHSEICDTNAHVYEQ